MEDTSHWESKYFHECCICNGHVHIDFYKKSNYSSISSSDVLSNDPLLKTLVFILSYQNHAEGPFLSLHSFHSNVEKDIIYELSKWWYKLTATFPLLLEQCHYSKCLKQTITKVKWKIKASCITEETYFSYYITL